MTQEEATKAITEIVITRNAEAKNTLFEMLPKDMATDVWFYIHLGNYGQTACKVIDETKALHRLKAPNELLFTLRFERGLGMNGQIPLFVKYFELNFNSKTDNWQQFLSELKENARAILGFQPPTEYDD